MSDYYYEIKDECLNDPRIKGKYLHHRGESAMIFVAISMSDRVWIEYKDKVYWYQNSSIPATRSTGELNAEELNEFVWIKLSAINI